MKDAVEEMKIAAAINPDKQIGNCEGGFPITGDACEICGATYADKCGRARPDAGGDVREAALAKAAQDFIDKVDRGEARSKSSYAAFKAALSTPPAAVESNGSAGARLREAPTYRVDYDGFVGTKIGTYRTREGREGVVLQQADTKIVHVYGANRVELVGGEAEKSTVGLNWELSDETRKHLDEIEKCIVRPGDPRLSQIICGNGDAAKKSEGSGESGPAIGAAAAPIPNDDHDPDLSLTGLRSDPLMVGVKGHGVEAGVASGPSDPAADRREIVAETMWRAELRRATGKERNIPWSEVAEVDRERLLYVADAILAALDGGRDA